MTYYLSTDFMNGAVTRVLLLFDRPSYMDDCDKERLKRESSSQEKGSDQFELRKSGN